MGADKKPKKKLIPAKTLSGFQDLLPDQALAFHDALDKITSIYRRYGYTPIDAPCIYLYETLAGEAGDIDKQLYRWTQGSKDVALRFDLTVPLARYVAANEQKLTFPFKRYHWGKVWRGESVQQKKGRYREFYQLDFDIVGTESPSADLEAVLVIHDAMLSLGVDKFTIRLNDRLLLNGLLAQLGLEDKSVEVLRAIDKLDKIGEEGVSKELAEKVGVDAAGIEALFVFTRLGQESSNEAILKTLEEKFPDSEEMARGIQRLRFICEAAAVVIPEGRLRIDPAIARGLGYYTGPVFETTLDELPEVGSVCSGGRYDDLASSYTKRQLPGVGASVGLSRLLAALDRLGQSTLKKRGTPILILTLPGVNPIEGVKLRKEIHDAGLEAEFYPQAPADWGKQNSPKSLFKYASQKAFRLALVLGESELENKVVQVKDLDARSQEECSRDSFLSKVKELLS